VPLVPTIGNEAVVARIVSDGIDVSIIRNHIHSQVWEFATESWGSAVRCSSRLIERSDYNSFARKLGAQDRFWHHPCPNSTFAHLVGIHQLAQIQ
jgi:hypothetical protein